MYTFHLRGHPCYNLVATSGKSPLKWTIFTGRKVSKDSMEGVLWAYAAASTIIEKVSISNCGHRLSTVHTTNLPQHSHQVYPRDPQYPGHVFGQAWAISVLGATWAFLDKGLAIVEELEGDGEAETATRVITARMNLLNCISSTVVVIMKGYQSMVREEIKFRGPLYRELLR